MPLNDILGRFCNFLFVIEILILCLFQGISFPHCWLVFWTQVPEGKNGWHNLFALSLLQPLSWKNLTPQWAGAGRKKKEKRKHYNSLKKIFFNVNHFCKAFTEFVKILLLFYVFVFSGHEACEILAPGQGIEPTLPSLQGKVLTTGPPGKSLL